MYKFITSRDITWFSLHHTSLKSRYPFISSITATITTITILSSFSNYTLVLRLNILTIFMIVYLACNNILPKLFMECSLHLLANLILLSKMHSMYFLQQAF